MSHGVKDGVSIEQVRADRVKFLKDVFGIEDLIPCEGTDGTHNCMRLRKKATGLHAPDSTDERERCVCYCRKPFSPRPLLADSAYDFDERGQVV